MCTVEGNTCTISATGTNPHTTTTDRAKRFYRHQCGQPALLNQRCRGTTTLHRYIENSHATYRTFDIPKVRQIESRYHTSIYRKNRYFTQKKVSIRYPTPSHTFLSHCLFALLSGSATKQSRKQTMSHVLTSATRFELQQ